MEKKWRAEEGIAGGAWRWRRMPRSRTARSLARQEMESIAAERIIWARAVVGGVGDWELGKVDAAPTSRRGVGVGDATRGWWSGMDRSGDRGHSERVVARRGRVVALPSARFTGLPWAPMGRGARARELFGCRLGGIHPAGPADERALDPVPESGGGGPCPCACECD